MHVFSTASSVIDMALAVKPYLESIGRKVFAGGGPYDLAATYDTAMEEDHTDIPCAIPMIVQGINEGEHLGLDLADFFQPKLLENYREWINSKQYTVGEIDKLIGARALSEIMPPTGRDRTSPKTARLCSTPYLISSPPIPSTCSIAWTMEPSPSSTPCGPRNTSRDGTLLSILDIMAPTAWVLSISSRQSPGNYEKVGIPGIRPAVSCCVHPKNHHRYIALQL